MWACVCKITSTLTCTVRGTLCHLQEHHKFEVAPEVDGLDSNWPALPTDANTEVDSDAAGATATAKAQDPPEQPTAVDIIPPAVGISPLHTRAQTHMHAHKMTHMLLSHLIVSPLKLHASRL